MTTRKITNTPFYSKVIGPLPSGCRMCVKGEKMVLYITGICPRSCWYCPLSENRKDKDVMFSNELEIKGIPEMIEETRISGAKGAGITGGDPLVKIDRTIEYIKALKKEFGKKFQIHLYTTFVLATKQNMQKLYDAGLDEIRFHPDFEKKSDWKNIENATEFDWELGLEIPCIPKYEKEIFDMIDYFEGKVQFLNINELEVAGRNMDDMEKEQYFTKTDETHGVEGSDELGERIMKYCQDKKINVHYCSSTLKDKVQLANRYKLRAENIKTEFDQITDEGQLYRGIIYLKGHAPIDNYKNKNKKQTPKEEILKLLKEKKEFLEEEGLELYLDEKKLRLISYPEHVEQFAEVLKELDLTPALVEEDPTVKAYETYINYL